jgi:hypothetical protein
MPISPSLYTFTPKSGFRVTRTNSDSISEAFRCSADNGKEVQINVEFQSDNRTSTTNDFCCNKSYLRSLGDDRTSCRSFISQSCQSPNYLSLSTSPCKDWKLTEFFKSPVELCKKEISPASSKLIEVTQKVCHSSSTYF